MTIDRIVLTEHTPDCRFMYGTWPDAKMAVAPPFDMDCSRCVARVKNGQWPKPWGDKKR